MFIMKSTKIFLLAGCVFLILFMAFVADPLPQEFVHLMDRAKMTFSQQDSVIEVEIKSNTQMNYEYALAYAGKHFEVRYAVRPLDSMLAKYTRDTTEKKPGSFSVDPNKMYGAAFQATIYNVFGGKMLPIKAFPPEAVKNEFNADWGGVASGIPSGEFGAGYKMCLMVAIHKQNAGDAYYFYLADSTVAPPEFRQKMKALFHTLRFKNE